MATIEVQGYYQRPQSKKSKGGKEYVQFGLGVKQKEKAFGDRPESVTWANFNVTDFSTGQLLEPNSYVKVTGYLKVREYEKDGQKRQSLDIVAQSVEDLTTPREGASEPKKKAAPAAKDDFDDLPF